MDEIDAIWKVLWAFEAPKSADPDGPAKLDCDLTTRDVIEARRALVRLAAAADLEATNG